MHTCFAYVFFVFLHTIFQISQSVRRRRMMGPVSSNRICYMTLGGAPEAQLFHTLSFRKNRGTVSVRTRDYSTKNTRTRVTATLANARIFLVEFRVRLRKTQ